jgi:hypothetical protein
MPLDLPLPSPPLFIVINPGSGEHHTGQTRELLARVFSEAGRTHQFIAIASPRELDAACGRAAAQAAAC